MPHFCGVRFCTQPGCEFCKKRSVRPGQVRERTFFFSVAARGKLLPHLCAA